MSKKYLKIKHGICPKCKGQREYVEEGTCLRKGRIERPERIIGWKCENCGDSKMIDVCGNTGLTTLFGSAIIK